MLSQPSAEENVGVKLRSSPIAQYVMISREVL